MDNTYICLLLKYNGWWQWLIIPIGSRSETAATDFSCSQYIPWEVRNIGWKTWVGKVKSFKKTATSPASLSFPRCVPRRPWMRFSSGTSATTLTPPATLGSTTVSTWTWVKRWRRTASPTRTRTSTTHAWTATSSPSPSAYTSTTTSLNFDPICKDVRKWWWAIWADNLLKCWLTKYIFCMCYLLALYYCCSNFIIAYLTQKGLELVTSQLTCSFPCHSIPVSSFCHSFKASCIFTVGLHKFMPTFYIK